MKIGDMVKNIFAEGIERYGIIVINDNYLLTNKNYVRVNFLPNPILPFHGDDTYHEYVHVSRLEVVSSVQ